MRHTTDRPTRECFQVADCKWWVITQLSKLGCERSCSEFIAQSPRHDSCSQTPVVCSMETWRRGSHVVNFTMWETQNCAWAHWGSNQQEVRKYQQKHASTVYPETETVQSHIVLLSVLLWLANWGVESYRPLMYGPMMEQLVLAWLNSEKKYMEANGARQNCAFNIGQVLGWTTCNMLVERHVTCCLFINLFMLSNIFVTCRLHHAHMIKCTRPSPLARDRKSLCAVLRVGWTAGTLSWLTSHSLWSYSNTQGTGYRVETPVYPEHTTHILSRSPGSNMARHCQHVLVILETCLTIFSNSSKFWWLFFRGEPDVRSTKQHCSVVDW